MNEIFYFLDVFGIALLIITMLVLIVALVVNYLISRKRAKKTEEEFLKSYFQTKRERERKRTPQRAKPSSKEISLQPGNAKIIVPQKKREVNRPPQGTLGYKFFGSALMLNGKPVIKSLAKQTHTVEVSETELFIDNKQYQVHTDTISQLRSYIYNLDKE